MPESKSVVIVGAGVIGLCSAYYALKRGHRVVVLERELPDHEGCSLGNAGMIVPSHYVPLAAPGMVGLGLRMLRDPAGAFRIRPQFSSEMIGWGWRFWRACTRDRAEKAGPLLRDMNFASRALYEELAGLAAFGLERKGLLMLCRTRETLQEELHMAAGANRLGILAEPLTPSEVAALDPSFPLQIAGAVYFPKDCHFAPNRFMAELTRLVIDAGGDIRWSTSVTGRRLEGDRIVALRTAEGDVEADEFVLAAGSWSGEVGKTLGLQLPMQAGRGYSVTLPRPAQSPAICSILVEARVAVTPMVDSLRFGGTMEIGGLDRTIQPARVSAMLRSIPSYFPSIDVKELERLPVWCGLRPCSPDGLPYLGRTARYANLTIATGHAMMGMSLGPITGEIVAGILSQTPQPIDIAMLDPDRYA